MGRTNHVNAHVVVRYSAAIYFAAALMLFMPPLDIILSLPQYQPGSARWRFGALGLVSGAMLVPILGLLLAATTAAIAQHRWTQRLVLLISGVMGITFLGITVLFGLDALQVRGETVLEVRRRYDIAVAKTLLMQLAQVVGVALIARATWRSTRSLDADREAKRTPELAAEVVGR